MGEPINPEAWVWYHRYIGTERCPVVDTWWQTETGAIMISPLPGHTVLKPGSATFPLPGIGAEVVDDRGRPIERGGGYLTLTRPWPAMLRGIYGDPERYRQTYWSRFPGMYFAGDGAKRDEDGYFWIIGRIDDVLNVAGHRIGTMEVESALVDHSAVAEAAVVGMEPGNSRTVTIPADEAYGPRREELTQEVDRGLLPDGLEVQPGMQLQASGPGQQPMVVTVAEVKDTTEDVRSLLRVNGRPDVRLSLQLALEQAGSRAPRDARRSLQRVGGPRATVGLADAAEVLRGAERVLADPPHPLLAADVELAAQLLVRGDNRGAEADVGHALARGAVWAINRLNLDYDGLYPVFTFAFVLSRISSLSTSLLF